MATSLRVKSFLPSVLWLMLVFGAASPAAEVPHQPTSQNSSWSNVLSLKHNQRIVVAMDGRPNFDAIVDAVDDSSLTVIAYGGTGQPERLSRTVIRQILTSAPSPQRKRGLAFLAAGVGAMAIGAAAKDPEAGPSPGFWVGLPLAIIGAVTLEHSKRHPVLTIVYQRP